MGKSEQSAVELPGVLEPPKHRPPRGRPRRGQMEVRNEELLDQALDLFLEHGFDGTTIDAIIEAVGMSRRTVYARYGDKTALFKAALQRAIDQWVVPVERLREAECAELEQTLLNVARLWVSNVRKISGMRLVRIANIEVFRRPEVAAYLWEQTAQPTLGYLTQLFRERLRPGQPVPDAEDAAAAFLILVVEGSIQLAVWGKMRDDDFDRQLAYRTRLFLNGAQVSPSA